ncbi:MAG: paraquat-inducible protein A [Acidobacteria bacterium]|nr:paraquat-inducible protein A [Acidobacteriota bacterium]
MNAPSKRAAVLALVLGSILLLLPGILQPVLTIRGVLTKDGVTHVAPLMLEKGLDDDSVATLKSMMNPTMVALLQATGGDLRKMLIDRLGPRLTEALRNGVGDVEVYTQTRSILGAVRNLYEVGSPLPATLILLFSVIVPLTKSALVTWAVFMKDSAMRQRTLDVVEAIAKWSMADVFVVALFITYLAAIATQAASPGGSPPLVAFVAQFGPGFYWFTAYCLFSLASQQYTARLARGA